MWVNLCSMRQSQRHFRADSATKPSSEAPQQGQELESICVLEGKLPLKSGGVPASTSLQRGMQSQGNILSLMVAHDRLPCARGKRWLLGEPWCLSPGTVELERPHQCCRPCGGAEPQEVCQEPEQCQPQQHPEQPGTGIQWSQPSLCSHGVALEVLEAAVEVQQPTRRSHTLMEEDSSNPEKGNEDWEVL